MLGMLLVLMLHGIVLYGLWSYRANIAPEKVVFLTMNLAAPPAVQPQHQEPHQEPHRQPQPPSPQPVKPLLQPNIADEATMQAQPLPLPPAAAAPTAQEPAQPLTLMGELSINCPERTPPSYPALSQRLGEQGRVVLKVELDEEGRVSGAVVKTHSGFIRLDEAALSAVKTWHCRPARRNGVAVSAVALQPFSFTLEDK